MKYKLIGNDCFCGGPVINEILKNRGVNDASDYFNGLLYSWEYFDADDIDNGIELINKHMKAESKIHVVVDCDLDGFTSAAIMINYLDMVHYAYYNYNYSPRDANIEFSLHENKEHGLKDVIDEIGDDVRLVIVPDAGSSDYEEHKILKDRGIDVLILDHHEAYHKSEYAVTINNQLSNYPNKCLTGAGVVWHFINAVDEAVYNLLGPTQFLDLCAWGNISDVADLRNKEIRTIVTVGMSNINNKLMRTMIEGQRTMMEKRGGNTYMSIAFYLTPLINAVNRVGTKEEKRLVFEAMLDRNDDKIVQSTKRGCVGSLVSITDEAFRIAKNVKDRQTKAQDSGLELAIGNIDSSVKNAVVSVNNEGDIDKNIAGLVANKLQDEYGKPAFVLINYGDEIRGSARNVEKYEDIMDLREICESIDGVIYAQGHASAFGIAIEPSKLQEFKSKLNESLPDSEMTEKTWMVDGELYGAHFKERKDVAKIAESKWVWGHGIKEPLILLKDVCLRDVTVELLSKDKKPTIKIQLPNNVSVIKFKSCEDEYNRFCEPDAVLTAVCECSINEYGGTKSIQLLICDYEIEDKIIL